MKRKSLIIALLILVAAAPEAVADEGMWMVQLLEKGLMKKMKKEGLKLPANVIYDEDAVSISDAVVSLDFGCTGSIISDNGLLITNHHCAYADVHAISTDEHNYLENGFWAFERSQEIPIVGKRAFFLKKALDITDDVKYVQDSAAKAGSPMKGRRLSSVMERRYADRFPGCEVSFESMWKGERYYLMVYKVYSDLRLVAAPPVCIAAFGGDVDNWEWPQHKGDFAMYRIYAAADGSPAEYSENNVPLQSVNHLKISAKGVDTGDFTMIMGYPGRTNRYNSSFGVDAVAKETNPISVKVQGEILQMMNRHMERKPATRLMYANNYFSISNVQELREGEVMTFRRYGVADIRRQKERELQEWIAADAERVEKYGTLLEDMKRAYEATASDRVQLTWYRECVIRGCESMVISTRIGSWLKSAIGKDNNDPEAIVPVIDERTLHRLVSKRDEELEAERFAYTVRSIAEHIKPEYRGEGFNELYDRFGGNAQKLAEWAWENSFMSSRDKIIAFVSEPHRLKEYTDDPAMRILRSMAIADFNRRISDIEERTGDISGYEKRYTHAMYEMALDKGEVQYPDANSTMRLTYGTVGPVNPADGEFFADRSTYKGILEKYNPDDYEFSLNERQLELIRGCDWGPWGDRKDGMMHINFLSNNDITGGNSGSPVMNSRGELVGLAFDGNKESLCGDTYFHPEYNKCVNVDIRYVLWILDRYAGMNYLFDEMEIIR